MKGMIEWFARNSVAANLMMVLIIVSGVIATFSVTEEVFPEIDLDRIQVEVPYLGAAPKKSRRRSTSASRSRFRASTASRRFSRRRPKAWARS